ncbi:hypothetical protein L5515_010362 [Caenorhabditis briggsae]|uniref:DUF38 domain-containing protein n=1 Tax=Caenorhabditis briggsae TaxID=6238 RepID=A0AAE9ELW2_CAEBR|nr:hypothetical protein L5515_010362 [Caenorhabditis briggsae]
MKNVLEDLDFFEIECLRKVSQNVRSCIEIVKPDPKIRKISLKFQDSNFIPMDICSKFLKNLSIFYQKTWDGYSVNRTSFDGPCDLSKIFLSDFEQILKNQRVPIELLDIQGSNEQFMDIVLGNCSSKFFGRVQVQNLSLQRLTDCQVFQILQFIDSKFLETITIMDAVKSFNLDDFSKLDQWKMAKLLTIEGFSISTPIQNLDIFNFSKMDIKVSDISMEDIIHLKAKFLESATISMLGQAPLGHIKSVSIAEKVKRILICLGFYTLSDPLEQEYESATEFQEDFQKVLNQRDTVLQEFKVRCDQQDSNVIELLSKQSKIPTEKVTLEVANSRQAMQIFPILDAGPLKSIDLKLKNDSQLWDDQRLIQVWRDKEGLEMEIILEELIKENMDFLKKILTNSRIFRKISIYFEKIDLGQFNKLFGPPSGILENSEIRKNRISREEHLRIYRDLVRNRIQFSQEPMEQRIVSALEVFSNSTILGNVAKFLDGIDMQSLRKVCKDLRFGLDSLKLDPKFQQISIDIREPGQVTVSYNDQKPITYREFDSNESYQSKKQF